MATLYRKRHSMYGLLLTATLAATAPLPTFAEEPHQFTIAPVEAASAIHEFGSQSGVQILASAEQLAGKKLNEVRGTLSTDVGLKTLLAGTGLTHRYVSERTVALVSETPRRTSRERLRLAQAPEAAARNSEEMQGQVHETKVEEIIVTAQKRNESLQDVPVPVSVLSAGELVDKNLLRLQDYAASVPGLNVGATSGSFQLVSIRGVSTASSSANPKVGILIDDVPIGASTHRGGGLFVPDLDPGDLAQVEVLRGPQGTLYGAGSLGGLIKYVTADPSLDRATGRLQTGVTSVHNGEGLGYNVRASTNVPLSDTFAASVSGFMRRESGYIDNLATGQGGFNEQQVSGGWFAGLWRPSDALSLRLSALYQTYEGDGPTEVLKEPGIGDLQTRYLTGAGEYRKEVQLYSATLKARIAAVDVVSVSAYSTFEPRSTQDFSTSSVHLNVARNQFGVTGVEQYDGRHFRKFSQEVRVSASLGTRVEWLLGGFYTRERADQFQGTLAVDAATGAVAGDVLILSLPSQFEEAAAFGNVTLNFTDRFDVQVGARQSTISGDVSQTWMGPYVPAVLGQPSPLIYPRREMDGGAFTYLVTPQFNVSPDLMVYARLASGYGAGGINVVPDTPAEFDSERTKNYELGLKGDFLDRTLSVDASLFYIDYTDLQLSLRNAQTGLTHTGNGSAAKSQGVELAISSRPLDGLTVAGWVAYTDAELTEPFPLQTTARGRDGDRLPATSRFSAYLSVDQQWPLFDAATLSLGAAASFVGERMGIFTSAPQRQRYPGYTKADLHARMTYESWTLNLFIDNVADKRGILFSDVRGATPAYFPIQPRTIGMNVTKAF